MSGEKMTDQELHDRFCNGGSLDNCGADHSDIENPCDDCLDMETCMIGDACPICKTKNTFKSTFQED